MDLIEWLGGYEDANAEYQKVKHLPDSAEIRVSVKDKKVLFAVGILRQDLDEYRCRNNISEFRDDFK